MRDMKILVYIFTFFFLNNNFPCGAQPCLPDQWEGVYFLDDSSTFIENGKSYDDATWHRQATVEIVYDYTNTRTYFQYNGTETHLSKSVPFVSTIINDYKKQVSYAFEPDGQCTKEEVVDMMKLCVYAEYVKHKGDGFLGGDSFKVKNYEFLSPGDDILMDYDITVATGLTPDTVLPVRLAMLFWSAEAGSGESSAEVYNIDVYNVVEKIRNESVFIPPPQCQHAKSTKLHRNKFHTILNKFGF